MGNFVPNFPTREIVTSGNRPQSPHGFTSRYIRTTIRRQTQATRHLESPWDNFAVAVARRRLHFKGIEGLRKLALNPTNAVINYWAEMPKVHASSLSCELRLHVSAYLQVICQIQYTSIISFYSSRHRACNYAPTIPVSDDFLCQC
jgi:hypothetical protein